MFFLTRKHLSRRTVLKGAGAAIGAGTGPRLSLIALGYAGWAPGQLEGEIAAGSWVVVQSDEALVFDQDYEKKWERVMARRTIQL